jgi:hypothetical protein
MARAGTFGRRPTTSTYNLTTLIASLLREQQAAKDKDVFDAYNNGGLFQGKPVTDQVLLDYIQARRDAIPKGDPLWDQWNNTLIQQKFSIGEQTVSLAYKQAIAAIPANASPETRNAMEARAAADVARFYETQLSSIPKDSAFYRQVAGSAAQWEKASSTAAAASGRGGGGSGSALTAARKVAAAAGDVVQARYATWYAMDQAVRSALLRAGYNLPASSSIEDVGGDIISNLFASGQVVGPNGALGLADYTQAALDYSTSLQTYADKERAANNNFDSILKAKATFDSNVIVPARGIDYTVRAEKIYDNLQTALKSANGDPAAIAAAYGAAYLGISKMTDDAKAAGADPSIISGLTNDAMALSGQTPHGTGLIDSIDAANAATGQAVHSFATPDKGVASGSAQIAVDIQANSTNQALLASGQGYLVQAAPGGAFTVQDQAQQPSSTLGAQYQSTTVILNGVPTHVYLQGTAVYTNTTQIKDANGNVVQVPFDPRFAQGGLSNIDARSLVGYQFTANVNGNVVTSWGYISPVDGTLHFTNSDPFIGPQTKFTGKDGPGIIVTTPVITGANGAAIPLDVNSILTPSADANDRSTSTTLAIDPAAQTFITSNPDRAVALANAGQIDVNAVVQALGGKAGMTPDQALVTFKQTKADLAAGYLAQRQGEITAGNTPTPNIAPPAQQTQSDFFNRLKLAAAGPGPALGTPPTVFGPPSPNWTQIVPQTLASQTTQNAGYTAQRLSEIAPAPIVAAPYAPTTPSALSPALPAALTPNPVTGISPTTADLSRTSTQQQTFKLPSGFIQS